MKIPARGALPIAIASGSYCLAQAGETRCQPATESASRKQFGISTDSIARRMRCVGRS